jgi:6-phospho-beta-glucosidase
MLYRIHIALRATPDEGRCDYLGLNHPGWLRRIALRGEGITDRLLAYYASSAGFTPPDVRA